jgi:deoxycytidine triphosphate deaminase
LSGTGRDYLEIVNFEERLLQHTFYYFRLGSEYEVRDAQGYKILRLTKEDQYLNLEPQGYAVIRSHETFRFSNKVMGILGPTSDFVRSGLELVHSPFIDPLFHGKLEMGLWNRLKTPISIRLGQRIGKIAFFDISDTSSVQILEGSIAEQKFKRRIPLRDDDPVPAWVEEDDPQEP